MWAQRCRAPHRPYRRALAGAWQQTEKTLITVGIPAASPGVGRGMAKTVIAVAFGGPEVLTVRDEPVPDPGPGQVQVRLRAIGVNPYDHKSYSGAFGTDPGRLPIRPGIEAAGVVVAVGPDAVTPTGVVAVGDEVIVCPGSGTYTELITVPAAVTYAKPADLPWEHAASLLSSGSTAVDALTTARVADGETVVVHGAAGAVGTATATLAVARGARVIGTARPVHHDALRALEVTPVEYGDGLADRLRALAPDGVDAVVDTVGTDEAIDVSLALVPDHRRIVSVVAFDRAARDGFRAIGGGDPDGDRIRREARPDLIALAGRGDLVIPVAATFPLGEAAHAHALLRERHPRGKFVLIP